MPTTPGPISNLNPPTDQSQEPHFLARTLLIYSEDHLDALATVARGSKQVGYSYLTLIRGLLAATARAFYLLEPGIGARERARRSLGLEREALSEQARLIGNDQSRAGQQVRRQIYALEILCKVNTLDLRVPKEMELIRQMTGLRGAVLYRKASAVVHGQPHGISPMVGISVDGEKGIGRVSVGLELDQLLSWGSVVMLAIDNTVLRACNQLKVGSSAWSVKVSDMMSRWAAGTICQ